MRGGAEREEKRECIKVYSVVHLIKKFKWMVLVARTEQEIYI